MNIHIQYRITVPAGLLLCTLTLLSGCGSTTNSKQTSAPVVDAVTPHKPTPPVTTPIVPPVAVVTPPPSTVVTEPPKPIEIVAEPVVEPPALSQELPVEPMVERLPEPPATPSLDPAIEAQAKTNQMNIRKVVVLLPDRPSLAEVNRDIENGIRKAHAAKPHNAQLQLIFLHDDVPAAQLMGKAQAHNPDWIIGPLTKSDITGSKDQLGAQQIVLNRTPETLPALQMGLSPEDEIEQLLQRTPRPNMPILVYLNNDNQEQRMLNILTQRAEQTGIPIVQLPHQGNVTGVSDWLNTQGGINNSRQRIDQISKFLRLPLISEPRTRQDIQALISLSTSKQTKGIMPILHYHQAPWSVIASSKLIPTRKETPFNEPDLTGVEGLVIPYLMSKNNINNSFEALGWDSYQALGYPKLQGLAGMTGNLSSNVQRHVIRRLDWKTITKGQIPNWQATQIVTPAPATTTPTP